MIYCHLLKWRTKEKSTLYFCYMMLDTACTLHAYACCAEIFNLQLSKVEWSQVLWLLIPKVRITWAVRLKFRVVSGFSHGPEPLANLKRGLQKSGKPSFSSIPPNWICSWTFFRGLMGVKSINVTWSYLFYFFVQLSQASLYCLF